MNARLRSVGLLCAWMLLARAAVAQSGAAAAELYRKGLADMKAGRYEAGCPALAESVRLDRRAGALFTLAECEAKWGKTASAVSHYDDYLAWLARMDPAEQSQQAERKAVALKQKEQLGASVPRATLILPPGTPAGVVVELDGLALNRPALGIALPVDPGSHRLLVRAEDGRSREQTFDIATGESRTIALLLPEPGSNIGPTPVETRAASTPTRSAPAVAKPQAQTKSRRSSTPAYVAFGVGASGVLVGAVSGGLALAEKPTVDAQCDAHVCDHDGKLAADRLQRYALVSTVGFGVGLLGLGVGTVLLATGGSSKRDASAPTSPSVVRVVTDQRVRWCDGIVVKSVTG